MELASYNSHCSLCVYQIVQQYIHKFIMQILVVCNNMNVYWYPAW